MVNDPLTEVIFVGLPGPTHHYGGLSADNAASNANRGSVSEPAEAARQVLALLRLLKALGVPAAVLPPPLRPHLPLLRQHFSGDDAGVIRQAARAAPDLLEKVSSASSMWAANAATVTPAPDTRDGTLHITVANLFTHLHRRIEAEDTYRVLKAIFAQVPDSVIHPPLSAAAGLRDEGAANHMRLSGPSGRGLHVFVYGADGSRRDPESARQTLSASRAIQSQHGIPDAQALFLRQNPDIILQGVFHNDVIAVSHGPVLLVHESAYEGHDRALESIDAAFAALHPGSRACIVTITDDALSVEEAVQTYLFNSQIVTREDGGMTLIAPAEIAMLHGGKGAALLERLRADGGNPIDDVRIVDLRQSMRNGGGPACLRLRVPVTLPQRRALEKNSGVMAGDALLAGIERIIDAHYPKSLAAEDLGDPALYDTSRRVMAELSRLMGLKV